MKQVNFNPTIIKKWCRQCDVTGKGMNEGYVWADGVFYTIDDETTAAELRKDLLEGCYNDVISNYNEKIVKRKENMMMKPKAEEIMTRDKLLGMNNDDIIGWFCEHDDFNTNLYWTEWDIEEEIENDNYYVETPTGVYDSYEHSRLYDVNINQLMYNDLESVMSFLSSLERVDADEEYIKLERIQLHLSKSISVD